MNDSYKKEITVGALVVYAENHMYARVELGKVESCENNEVLVRSLSSNRINKRQPQQLLVMPKDYKYY